MSIVPNYFLPNRYTKGWLRFSGNNPRWDMVKDHRPLSWIMFSTNTFVWNIVESIREDENLKSKPQVRMTPDRIQHNVELFLSSKMGHSLKRDVKIFRCELKDDHHHHPTTHLLEGIWEGIFWFQLHLRDISKLIPRVNFYFFQIRVIGHLEFWILCPSKFFPMDVKRSTFMVKRLQAFFS